MIPRIVAAPLIVTLFFIGGCGGTDDAPVTLPVTGTVTLDGKPLEGAVVTFIATAEKQLSATGTTDKDGKYKLVTGSSDGAQTGSYKVTVQHYVNADGTPIQPTEGMDAQMLGASGDAKSSLPPSYTEDVATVLKAEVKAGDTTPIDFKLKADGSAP